MRLCLESKWHSLLWVMLYPLAGFSLCSNKELAFTLVIPLLIQDQPYTPNYLLIHPFHTAFLPSFVTAPACWNAGRASSLWTAVWDLFFKHRFSCWFTWRDTIDLGVSLWGETLKLSYAVECGKKSVMTYTWMAPLHQTPWVCHSQALDPTPPYPKRPAGI